MKKIKMKTKKGAAKRFKKTASGKIKRQRAFTSHLLSKKKSKRKRNLRKSSLLSNTETKRVKKMMPY